jgi:DNA polymerase-3 subunit delta
MKKASTPTSTDTVHLLLGPELGQKNQYIAQLYQSWQKSKGEVLKSKFYPYDTQMAHIIEILRTPDLFGTARMMILANIEDFKAADFALLYPCLTNLDSTIMVVLTSDETQTSKIDKKLDQHILASNKKIFWEMFEDRKHEWIADFFRRDRLSITADAIDRLLELVENNTQDLRIACEALSGFFKERGKIDALDVETFVIHSKEENVFSLFEHFVQGNKDATYEILARMAYSQDGIGSQTFAGLLWQLRKLVAVKEAQVAGDDMDTALRQNMILGKLQQTLYRKACTRFDLETLRRMMADTPKLDAELRSNLPKLLQRIAIETFLLKYIP